MAKKKSEEAERLEKILRTLHGPGPAPRPGLEYSSPWELLIATILSAQCTDERVNLTTPALFAAFREPGELARADVAEVEKIIRSIGLYRNKAKNIVETARLVAEKFGGKVPGEREALQSLPGVGRKTASVVLAQGFGVPAFAVDTHVGRVGFRMGFSPSPDPEEVEKRMTALMEPQRWRDAHLILIFHGRKYCKARSPDCPHCPVSALCPAVGVKKAL